MGLSAPLVAVPACPQALTRSTHGEAKAARMPAQWRLQQKRKALEAGYLQEVYSGHKKACRDANKLLNTDLKRGT